MKQFAEPEVNVTFFVYESVTVDVSTTLPLDGKDWD